MKSLIFIHINKTGGTSIEKALRIPSEHKTALEKIVELGRANWDRRFTFAVARNPWDRVVSHYHYRVQTNQTRLADDPIAFSRWVCLAYGQQDPVYYDNPIMFMPQMSWIADHNGNVLVDKTLRFETLSKDFVDLCQTIGKT
ncbi:MAG: sulfotransferase family 2 domain-containing protein, partial [Arenicellales bacterium]|nr:sulfotransferase family 2 domain-containing protein [Arenicellales bacterium]